jgi:5-methylcytosine-specific restriction endonuclease McrA
MRALKFSSMIRKALKEQRGVCCHCGNRLLIEKASGEHIVPYSFGGRTNAANISAAHEECNNERATKFSGVYFGFLSERQRLDASEEHRKMLAYYLKVKNPRKIDALRAFYLPQQSA